MEPMLCTARLCVLLIALVSPVAGVAADPFARCAAIDHDVERLACYDAMSGRRAPAQSRPPDTDAREAPAAAAAERREVPRDERSSLLGAAWMLDPAPGERELDIRYHRPNYLLFARYTNDVNNKPFSPVFAAGGIADQQLDSTEAKFQLSFKARLWRTGDRRWTLWLAYTQQNQWQVYNDKISRPFRETNYQPELFATFDPRLEWGGFRWRVLNVGYNHQSNGRADPLSRSWDRIVAEAAVERGNFVLLGRLWYRIPESADKDDNADISDYLGYGDLTAVYRWRGHTFKGMLRGNAGTGKGAGELTWSSPPLLGPLRLYAQLFSGYGESMIDYNWRQTTIGAGIALNDLP